MQVLAFPYAPNPVVVILLELTPAISVGSFESMSLGLTIGITSSTRANRLRGTTTGADNDGHFFILEPIIFLHRASGMVSHRGAVGSSPKLGTIDTTQ